VRAQDRQFFDSFMLVIGILIGVAVGLVLLVRAIAIDTQGQFVLEDPTVQTEIDARIAPIGHVVMLGTDELQAATQAAAAPARAVTTLSGPQVYNEACYLCHAAPGVGGAPVIGNAELWGPRVAQGHDTLVEHALNGYQGSTGFMPAKGGRMDLSDDEIVSAIDYMLSQLPQE
jgi:cytochrome c5